MLQFPKWCYLHCVYTIIPQRQRHRYYHYCFTIVHEVKTTWMDKNAIAINIINSVQKMTWIWCTEESNHSNLLDLSRILCTETETMRAVSWMSGMSSAKPSDSSSSVNCRNLDEPFTLVFPPLQYTHWTYCQLENKLPLSLLTLTVEEKTRCMTLISIPLQTEVINIMVKCRLVQTLEQKQTKQWQT